MRKELTPEQKEKRDARRQQFRALWKKVAAMGDSERTQLAAKFGFRTVEGHELSLCNTMLIAMQLPTASVLGGFRQWIKNGRGVRKGEHGAMIWVPIGVAKDKDATIPQTDNSAEAMERHFIIGTIFDISQTEEITTAEQ